MKKYHRGQESARRREEIELAHSEELATLDEETVKVMEQKVIDREEAMERLRSIPIERGVVERKSIREYPALFHQFRFGDLFLLWRDKEVPMSATGDATELKGFTDAEPNTVMTFWHKEKILDPDHFSYFAVGELDTSQLPESLEVGEGTMRYAISDMYDDYSNWGELPEVYVDKRIPASMLSVKVAKSEKEFAMQREATLVEKLIAGETVSDLDTQLVDGMISQIIWAEQGQDTVDIDDTTRREYLPHLKSFFDWIGLLPAVDPHDEDSEYKSYEDFTEKRQVSK